MPVYEYGCTKCKREFEYQQRMSDPPMKKCEACGGKLERLISRTSFQLKGGGWYKDLYASSKSSDTSGGGDGASSTSSDAKPAATDAKPAASDAKPAAKPANDAAPAKKKTKQSSKGK